MFLYLGFKFGFKSQWATSTKLGIRTNNSKEFCIKKRYFEMIDFLKYLNGILVKDLCKRFWAMWFLYKRSHFVKYQMKTNDDCRVLSLNL